MKKTDRDIKEWTWIETERSQKTYIDVTLPSKTAPWAHNQQN